MSYRDFDGELLGQNEIAVSPSYTTFFTTDASMVNYVKSINLTNNGTGTAIVYIHIVEPAGSPGNANCIAAGIRIKKNAVVQMSEISFKLPTGYSLQMKSSIAGVCARVDGVSAV